MWLLLSRVILPSVSPEAPSVFSLTLGTCCLKTSGVSLRGERRRWAPRPGPQASTDGASDASDASDADPVAQAHVAHQVVRPLNGSFYDMYFTGK